MSEKSALNLSWFQAILEELLPARPCQVVQCRQAPAHRMLDEWPGPVFLNQTAKLSNTSLQQVQNVKAVLEHNTMFASSKK